MSVVLRIGDVRARLAEIPDGSVDAIFTSPPFWSQREYLPSDHPLKEYEMGREPTPAAFIDNLLALTAEFGRILAPHGSIAIELGDKRDNTRKSMFMLPQMYAASLSYGRNMLTAEPSPAGKWLIRNFIPWVRPNPPVGFLGDRCRDATSYITVATLARDRWWDMEDCRSGHTVPNGGPLRSRAAGAPVGMGSDVGAEWDPGERLGLNPAGAPLLDWWDTITLVLDEAIKRGDGPETKVTNRRTAKDVESRPNTLKTSPDGNRSSLPILAGGGPSGSLGKWVTDTLRNAGAVDWGDAWWQTTEPYKGRHYAAWPEALAARLIRLMCPLEVCRECGQPRRRITETVNAVGHGVFQSPGRDKGAYDPRHDINKVAPDRSDVRTLGWSDCGHGPGNYRPGIVLDPFAGTFTTGVAAQALGRDAIGIDLDPRNADLARERCGMFLTVDDGGARADV